MNIPPHPTCQKDYLWHLHGNALHKRTTNAPPLFLDQLTNWRLRIIGRRCYDWQQISANLVRSRHSRANTDWARENAGGWMQRAGAAQRSAANPARILLCLYTHARTREQFEWTTLLVRLTLGMILFSRRLFWRLSKLYWFTRGRWALAFKSQPGHYGTPQPGV